AIQARKLQALAKQALKRTAVQADGAAAQVPNAANDVGVDFLEQNANDDGQGFIIRVAAALDFLGVEAGCGHGPVNRLAPAVHQDGSQAHRLHKDHILQNGLQDVALLHGAAAQFDHCQPVAEPADIAEGLDQHISLANGIVHRNLYRSSKWKL